MLKMVFLTPVLLSIAISASANPLVGKWIYSHDECVGGKTPNDRWSVLGLVNRSLIYSNNNEVVETAIFETKDKRKCAGSLSGTFFVQNSQVIETINFIQSEDLKRCGIEILTKKNVPRSSDFTVTGSDLRLKRPDGGEHVCERAGALTEIFVREQ